jgi:hypothetical protein
MEEVTGSIPVRSTNKSFFNSYLPAPSVCLMHAGGCERVLKVFHIQRQHHLHDFQARFTLLLVDRAGVNIKRCAATGVSNQLLSNFDIDTKRPEIRRE